MKVPTHSSLWRVCVAALFSLALAACGDGRGVEATTSPEAATPVLGTPNMSGTTNPDPSTWLTDTPIDQSKTFVDGVDTSGLMKLRSSAPYGYEAGKRYGDCTVVYRSFNSDNGVIFEVAIKPVKGAHQEGLKAADVDPWIATYKTPCRA